jgi:hypothetical protein
MLISGSIKVKKYGLKVNKLPPALNELSVLSDGFVSGYHSGKLNMYGHIISGDSISDSE